MVIEFTQSEKLSVMRDMYLLEHDGTLSSEGADALAKLEHAHMPDVTVDLTAPEIMAAMKAVVLARASYEGLSENERGALRKLDQNYRRGSFDA